MFLFLLVVFAFGCGMTQLLWYYADLEMQVCYRWPTDIILSLFLQLLLLLSFNKIPASLPGGLPNFDEEEEACTQWRRFANLWETSQVDSGVVVLLLLLHFLLVFVVVVLFHIPTLCHSPSSGQALALLTLVTSTSKGSEVSPGTSSKTVGFLEYKTFKSKWVGELANIFVFPDLRDCWCSAVTQCATSLSSSTCWLPWCPTPTRWAASRPNLSSVSNH